MTNWKELLKQRDAWCYIKPTMFRHDSGYRTFEVGYCTLTKDGRRTADKKVLSKHSDHFRHTGRILENKPPIEFSMDILLDGYIRCFSTREILTWDNKYDWVVSSFSLEVMK